MARGNGEGTIVKRKDGRWMGAVTIGVDPKTGKPKRKYIYGKKRKEVAREMTNLKKNLFEGTYKEPSNMKLADWLDKWIEGRKNSLAYSTYMNYEMFIRNHIKPEIGQIKLKDIKPYEIQLLLNNKFENGRVDNEGGLSERSVKYIYQTLHAALEKAVKTEMIIKNPCKSVELPKDDEDIESNELHTWNNQQVKKFLRIAKDFKYHSAFYLALNTGMRQGELIGLKWKDINYNKKTLNVKRQVVRTNKGLKFKTPKTKAGDRVIPLFDNIIKYLKKHKINQSEKKLSLGESFQDNNLVTCNGIGNPVGPRNLSREFKKIVKAADLPKIRFHDMRHTFATTFLDNGGNIKTLQQILGHESITTTIDTYGHVTDEMLSHAGKIMETMYKTVER